MEAYEGREPYIFISYARVDAGKVTPLLEALSSAGYRFWYDASTQAGADWLEVLLGKVAACAVFCPLFSKEFLASLYCFVEAAWAYQNEKKIVHLYLEKLEKESFRRLYHIFQNYQGLPLYEYADVAQFVEHLRHESAFALCKAPEWHKLGQIQWRFSESDDVLTIAKNESRDSFGSIPSYQYDAHYGSSAPWMKYREKILSVEIANDIDEIGDRAFYNCPRLKSARISNSVTKIGDYAFWGCKKLSNVYIPDSVTKIGERAFTQCTNLIEVHLSNKVTKIAKGAFQTCESLKNLRIPDSVTIIGNCAFWGCKKLSDVRIPDNVTEIEDGAFWGCESLKNMCIPDSVTQIGKYAFDGCASLKSVEIPVKAEIGTGAFPKHTRVIRRAAPEQ